MFDTRSPADGDCLEPRFRASSGAFGSAIHAAQCKSPSSFRKPGLRRARSSSNHRLVKHMGYMEDIVAAAQQKRAASNPQNGDKQGHADLLRSSRLTTTYKRASRSLKSKHCTSCLCSAQQITSCLCSAQQIDASRELL